MRLSGGGLTDREGNTGLGQRGTNTLTTTFVGTHVCERESNASIY